MIGELLVVVTVIIFALIIVYYSLKKEIHTTVNFGPKDAIKTSNELITRADRELKIVTDLTPLLFEDESVLISFREALGKGVNIKILFDPLLDLKETKKELKTFFALVEESKNQILIKKLTKSPPYHFWLADANHLRLEQPHPLRDVSKVHGEIKYNTLRLGTKYEKIFDSLWYK